VALEEEEQNLNAHRADWCERQAERIYEISVDSFCQTVMPNLQQSGLTAAPPKLAIQAFGRTD
jgi:hypothetical protein